MQRGKRLLASDCLWNRAFEIRLARSNAGLFYCSLLSRPAGSKADIFGSLFDVRFTPESGHGSAWPRCPLCVVIRSPSRPHQSAAAVTCSEPFVESVLDEVIQHPVGLKRRRGIKLGDALHHSFFFGKGVQPTTKIEHLPVGAGAIHLGL